MKHSVDIATWSRRDNWRFMKEFANSWYSITTEIDCTEALETSKRTHTSFFMRYLYAMMRAANEVKAFGYRPDGDGVCWFDTIGATVPVAVEGGTFYTVLIPYVEDYAAFCDRATRLMADIPADGDPYGVNRALIESGETGVINISATPQLYFTSMTYTFHKPGLGSDWPLMNVGKAVRREGRWVMPVGIYVDHCFVDGANLADFVNRMQKYMNLPQPLKE